MLYPIIRCSTIAALSVFFTVAIDFAQKNQGLAQAAPAAPAADDNLYLEEKQRTNAGTVSIMVSGLNCTCAQFAEDIRNVVNDIRPGGQRALISLGEGGPHNLKDLIYLLGSHMTIVDEKDLKRLKQQEPVLYADADKKLHYITKLYNAEFHILARGEIKSVAELDGKAVNVELPGAQTDLVSREIFGALGIAIKPTHHDDVLAQEKLVSGEIAAMVLSTGAPQASLRYISKETGLHFLPLDEASLPGHDLKPILSDYLPAELTSEAYPNLIAPGETVPTVASRMVLAIYNWPENGERWRRNQQFIGEFFSKIEEFRHPARHPKWKEVNIAAEVPGWTRFKPAQDWLNRNKAALTAQGTAGAETRNTSFESSVEQGGADSPVSPEEREALFRDFQKFLETRKAQRPAR